MNDLVERLRFDATRCELQFSKGVAGNINEAADEIESLRERLEFAEFEWNRATDGMKERDTMIDEARRSAQQPRMEALEQDCQHVEAAQDDRCMDDMQLAHNARMAAIKECIRAVADVMPDSAGGPVFDALRALAVTSTDSVIAREYKDLLEVIDHTLTVHGHMDAHTPLHDRLQRLISVSASRFNLG